MVSLVVLLALTAAPAPVDDAPPSAESLRAQAARCRSLLKTSLVDLYLPAEVDRANGGYFEEFRGGKFANSGEKFLVAQSRQLWFFSTLAREGVETDASLSAAKTGFDFLQAKMRDPKHGGYFAKVKDDGTPSDRRKHAYLNSFALYGLVAYYRASNDPAALDAAKKLFHALETSAHDAKSGGYLENFREDWTAITDPSAPGIVGAIGTKTYNTHLHLLESFADLYRVWPDPLVRTRLEELLLILTTTVRHPEYPCNIDGWLPDWRIVDKASNLRASYGHDIECAWLVLDAASALGTPRPALRNWAETLCGYSVKFGYDCDHGGFFYTGPLGKPSDDTKKEWWVQAEALPSLLTLYRESGRLAYYDRYVQTLDFIEKHQIAPDGGWYQSRKADGSPLSDTISSPWQCSYHNGRALIVAAKLLDELAKGDR